MDNASLEDSVKILILVGAVDDETKINYLLASIKAGLDKWAKKMDIADGLNDCLAIFSEECKIFGQSDALAPHSKLACTKNNINVHVLFSPTCVMVNNGIAELILSPCAGRLVVYGGHFLDSKPNWCFQDGIFAVEDLEYILNDQEIISTLLRTKMQSKITICCSGASNWELSHESGQVEMEFVDPFLPIAEVNDGPPMGGLKKFVEDLEDTLKEQVEGVFFQLSPPKQRTFLRAQRPSIYIFPAGNGDSAFFKVDGFNVLINGGALTRPWFWHLIRHEYRMDCVVATHLGQDSLAGLNSFFLRKVHEQKLKFPKDQDCEEFKYLSKFILSPDLGMVYINAPSKFLEELRKRSESTEHPHYNGDSTIAQHLNVKTTDTVHDTFRLLRTLQIDPQPLTRKPEVQPITLLYNRAVGKLEMFVLSPDDSGKEIDFIRQKWGISAKSTEQMTKSGVQLGSDEEGRSLVSDLASICCLLVWFPANPKERIIRVLFPGNTSESKIFEGLALLKDAQFLSYSAPTGEVLAAKNKAATKPTKSGSNPKPTSTSSKTSAVVDKSAVAPPRQAAGPSTKTGVGGARSRVTTTKRFSTTRSIASSTKPTQSTVKTSSALNKPSVTKTVTLSSKSASFSVGTSPAPAKATAAAAKIGKVSAPAQKKASTPPRKLPNEANITTRSKREDPAKPAEKQPKSSQPQTSKTLATKSKTGLSQPRPEARVNSKKLAEKTDPRTKDPKNLSNAAEPKQTKASKPLEKSKKVAPASLNKPKQAKFGLAKSPSKKTDLKSSKTTAQETPLEVLDQSLEALNQKDQTDKETTPLLKRPTPEGQDGAEQEHFLEIAPQVDVQKDSDLAQSPTPKDKIDPTPSPSDYLTVSPKASKPKEVVPVEIQVANVKLPETSSDVKNSSDVSVPEVNQSQDAADVSPLVLATEIGGEAVRIGEEEQKSSFVVSAEKTNEDAVDIEVHSLSEQEVEPLSNLEEEEDFAKNLEQDTNSNKPAYIESTAEGNNDKELEPFILNEQPSSASILDDAPVIVEEEQDSERNFVTAPKEDLSPIHLKDGEFLNLRKKDDLSPTHLEDGEFLDLRKKDESLQIEAEIIDSPILKGAEAPFIAEEKDIPQIPETPALDDSLPESIPQMAEIPQIPETPRSKDDQPPPAQIDDSFRIQKSPVFEEDPDILQTFETTEDPQIPETLRSKDDQPPPAQMDDSFRIQKSPVFEEDADILQTFETTEDPHQSSIQEQYIPPNLPTLEETLDFSIAQKDILQSPDSVKSDHPVDDMQRIIPQTPEAEDVRPSSLQDHFIEYREKPVFDSTLLDQTTASNQFPAEESAVGDTTPKDASLEPLKTEFAQLGIGNTPQLTPEANILFEDEKDSQGDQELKFERPENLEKNFAESGDLPFYAQNEEYGSYDNSAHSALLRNDQINNFNDDQASTELDNRVNGNFHSEEQSEIIVVIPHSTAIDDNIQAREITLENCGSENVAGQEEKYLEFQNAALNCEADAMSCTPLSSGPSFSADNLQELATPQEMTSLSGIVEFDNLGSEKQAVENVEEKTKESNIVESPLSDIAVLENPESEIQAGNPSCGSFPTGFSVGNGVGVEADVMKIIQSADSCYDDNGNRTEMDLKTEDDSLRGDALASWTPDDVAVSDDVTTDNDVLISDQGGIVSFRDSEDNLMGKNNDATRLDDVILRQQEKEQELAEGENSSFVQKPSDILEPKEEKILQKEEQLGLEPEDAVLIGAPPPVEDEARAASPSKPVDLESKPKEKSVYDSELDEANFPSLKERSPTDEYISALGEDLSAGASLAASELVHDLKTLHAGDEYQSKDVATAVAYDIEKSGAGVEDVSQQRDLDLAEDHLKSGEFVKPETSKSDEELVQESIQDGEKNEESLSAVPLISPMLDPYASDGLPPAPQVVQEAELPESHLNFAMNNPFLVDIGQQPWFSEDYPPPVREEDPSMAPQDRSTSSKPKKPTTSSANKKESPHYYFDLAYVPHHANKNHCGVEFFKRIRSKYYVLSGFDAKNHEPSSETLNGLLEGKKTWSKPVDSDDTNTSVIPTHNSNALFNWFEKNHQELSSDGIHLVAIGSRVKLLDENIEACKIEL